MDPDSRASGGEITRLLSAWSNGQPQALDELIPLIYAELHRMANRHMGGQRPGHTLQATALINEAWVKVLGGSARRTWQDRAHFFGVASIAMRQILVNHAQASLASKRGGDCVVVPLEDAASATEAEAAEVIAVDDALKALAKVDERKARVVELRYFGGLSLEETAEVLQISPVTVSRDWQIARSWLARELGRPLS